MAESRDSGAETPDGEDLSQPPTAADSVEALLADAVAAPSSLPLITADTVVADRFVVEKLLGMGGMGAVYLARDRVLGRSVALKLHRTTASATRLHREAVAMARLSHPNVVTVFEVGSQDGRPFVAMEYIEGETLRGWLTGQPRSRAQILDAMLAAGEGLAAAHDAKLVHRDVKPDNILIGRDGRVRIGDFGLAQAAAASESPVDVALTPLTGTGTVVGTPAYMAPEQLDGGMIDAQSDQFAFCVVTWEAMCGERPFVGADTRALRAAIGRGVPRLPRGKLPPRFRSVLARGLAVDPAARWPSMRALLGALRRARRRPAIIGASAATILAAAAIVTWSVWPTPDPIAACDDVTAPFDRELPVTATLALVTQVRAAGGPEANNRATTIGRVLDGYRGRARAVTLSACRARASKQWPNELSRASDECLDDQARSVREILGAVPTTRAGAADLLVVAGGLPDVEQCGDARFLAGWRPLAADDAQRSAVVSLRGRIEAALAKLSTGQVANAASIVDELDRTPLGTALPVKHRVALLRGSLDVARSDLVAGERHLAEGYFAARADDDGELALRIVGELIRIESVLRRNVEAADRWVKNGLADAEREHVRHPNAAASVYLRAASAATITGDGDVALQRVERSESLRGALPANLGRAGAYAVRADAYAMIGNTDAALAASDQYIAKMRIALGEHHPAVAEALADRASMLLDANRVDDAVTLAREAAAIVDAEGDTTSVGVASVKLAVGATLLNLEDPGARKYLEEARDIWIRTYGENHPDVALADTNLAIVYLDAGETERALTALRKAAAVTERTVGADHVDLASVLYNLAVAERNAGQLDAALGHAQRVAAIFEQRQKGSVRHVYALAHIATIFNLLKRPAEALSLAETAIAMPKLDDEPIGTAWLQLEAGRALVTQRRDRPRAQKLLTDARKAYEAANLPDRVREIDELIR